jgi:hypothetical protein
MYLFLIRAFAAKIIMSTNALNAPVRAMFKQALAQNPVPHVVVVAKLRKRNIHHQKTNQ